MSIPRTCAKCGEVVGVVNPGNHIHIPNAIGILAGDRVDLGFDRIEKAARFNPDGPCNHPKPKTVKERKFFGLIEEVTRTYADGSVSYWEEYIGKNHGRDIFLLWAYVKLLRHDVYSGSWIFHDLAGMKEIREKVQLEAA